MLHTKNIRSYLATGRIAKKTAAKRAHGAALSKKLWRLQNLLDAAATKEEDLLAAATKARNEDAPLTFGSSTLAAKWSST